VHGSSNGEPKPSGNGGFLRDHEGSFCVFSCSTGIKKLNVAEVLTIKKAFQVSIDCSYVLPRSWIVEYNTITLVKRHNIIRSRHLQDKFNNILNSCSIHFFLNFAHSQC
jgi:hypothetical protein